MPFSGVWCKVWIYFGFVFAWTKGARPRFDTSTDMGLVLVPADAEVDSVIFRLRATDQDADFPLVFEITATITPVVRIDNLPCTLYNKVCQANVILTKRLVPERLHDFAVRVRDTKGDSNSMQATISVTNATTPRDKIFPHIPSLIMVPENTRSGKELDYLLARANSWSGKPVYIELWQPKELFTIRQRQTPTQTRGVITLIGELDFETQSVYTLTMYATDPYTQPGKDTRNIAGLNVVVIVTDVQDVPPLFTLAPPLTRINNSVQPGDIVLRVHAEDGDKGVPREIVYGLVSEGNPFTPFFNISETSGEVTLARPLEELTQITHVGAPVVLTVVAEEIRRSRDEPPAQATVVDVGFLLGEPGNTPPYFESDNYVATIDENLEAGTVINFGEQYTTRVKDEDVGKAGVFALKLENNNGTFEINPTVAERIADFILIVRDNTLIDYELYRSLTFKIVAQEVGPATNLSKSVPVTIFLKDINDNPPVFDQEIYGVTLSENVTVGSRVIQVHATDIDTGIYGDIHYTGIMGEGSEAFVIDPNIGLITVAMGSTLDREVAAKLELTVEARDENGNGNRGVALLIVNLLDVNDNPPIFEKDIYDFMLNGDLTNFTSPAVIKALDADTEPPNNIIRYEIIHGNYENKFYLNDTSGELILRSPIVKIRRKKQSAYDTLGRKVSKKFVNSPGKFARKDLKEYTDEIKNISTIHNRNRTISTLVNKEVVMEVIKRRRKRDNENSLYTLTARAYDLGIPHLSSVTKIRVISGIAMEARIMIFVVPGEQPNSTKTAETLATITGGRVTVLETRPYVQQNRTGSSNTVPGGSKKSIIIARVEQTEPGTPLVDVEKIRETLAANGVGIIGGTENVTPMNIDDTNTPVNGNPHVNNGQTTIGNTSITNVQNEEVQITVYKAENKLLIWLLIILGLLMLLAIAILIICCICPGCPFYMAPRKRRVHSSETLVVRSDGRPKRHLHRQPMTAAEASWNGRKQAWSADPTRGNWHFNKRNVKNCSLPGDVAYISGPPNDIHMNHEAHRLRDVSSYEHSRKSRMDEQDRMYMEEIDGQKQRGYDMPELDSLQRHEVERGSDIQRQGYRRRYMEHDMGDETVREQHFYREGNAEVLRLVTRGQAEDSTTSHHHHHHHCPTTLIVDGKDIILQRFIEDQKSRPDLSMQDVEAARMMESHQRSKEMYQQQHPEVILIPERLDLGHRQHIEEIGPNVQRLVIDHGDYGSQKMEKESQKSEKQDGLSTEAMGIERPSIVTKDHAQTNKAQYSFNNLEVARQKALLARLLLKRDNRQIDGGILDSASYLETQSLPGQVAIATQTDRTAATQTDRHVRSRSFNDESDDDSRHRKKLKSRKKYGDGDWKRTRTLWMKSPIDGKSNPCFDKRLSILRRKVKEVKEDKKVSLEPDVLREISDSLNGNESSCKGAEDESPRAYHKLTEQSSISHKVLNEKENDSSTSTDLSKKKHEKTFEEKSCVDLSDDPKLKDTESVSSSDMKAKREKHGRNIEKSPKKEVKSKVQKKTDSAIKPSFRILEKEFTMLTKKFSKLREKKFQESTGSDSTTQEKVESKDSKKDPNQKSLKKTDASSPQRQAAIAKTKQKLRYQQPHVMSTGSSEYDDVFDKNKKQGGVGQDAVKQKQPISTQSHAKLKRQTHIGRQEFKKQMTETRDEGIEKRKDGASKEYVNTEMKLEKTSKTMTRAPKLAVIPRKDRVMEETSTSPSSDQAGGRKDKFNVFVTEKKSTTDSSGTDFSSGNDHEKKSTTVKVIQRFSDDFVEQSNMESTKQHNLDNLVKDEKVCEKTESAVHRILVIEGELKDAGAAGVKSIKTEEQLITKTATEDSTIHREVVQHLIKTSVVPDAVQAEEGKLIGTVVIEDKKFSNGVTPSDANSAIMDPKEHEKEYNKFTTIANDIKFTGEGGIQDEQEKYKASEGTQHVLPVIGHALGMYKNKTELSEKNKSRINQTENIVIKHKQEVTSDTRGYMGQSQKEILEAIGKKDKLLEEYTMEEEKETREIFPKENEVETLQSHRGQVLQTEQTVEDGRNIKERKEKKLELEKSIDEQDNGKTDLIEKMEDSIEVHSKTELLRDEKKDLEQEKAYEVKEPKEQDQMQKPHEEMEKHTQYSGAESDYRISEREKTDTIEIVSKDDKMKDVNLNEEDTSDKEKAGKDTISKIHINGQVKETVLVEENVSEDEKGCDETSDHNVKKNNSPEKESKLYNRKSFTTEITPDVQLIADKSEISSTSELLDEEKKSSTDVKSVDRGMHDKETESQTETGEGHLIEKKVDETTLEEKHLMEEKKEEDMGGEKDGDVSLPLFTDIMQTVDDLDDSDSSSDISRKTTLTTRPYQTPRHHSRENIHTMESTETQDVEDEEDTLLEIELLKDDGTLRLEQDEMFIEAENVSEEQFPLILTETVEDVDSKSHKDNEIPLNVQAPSKLGEIITDVEEEYIKKDKPSKSNLEVDDQASSSTKHTKHKEVKSPRKDADRIYEINSPSLLNDTKSETTKPSKRKFKGTEKRRTPTQRKKKSSSEESSEDRANRLQNQMHHSRYKPRRKYENDQSKQKYSSYPKQLKKADEEQHQKPTTSKPKVEKDRKIFSSSEKHPTLSKGGEIDTSKAQPKYMAWYKKNREEMERKRAELKASDDESLPRWLRRSMRSQKSDKDEKKKSDHASDNTNPRVKRKIKPLVNVESEQLKAIVRQGRKLRKAEGGKNEDPPVQIFATSPPAASLTETKHHLVQHSEYKYEKILTPFYLHPPPAPHPSPQLSPEHFEAPPSLEHSHVDEDFDSGIAIPLQGGNRLRHQQLLEKKSVFDIAYSEAAPSQLRADSTTPPS
ncbi:Cadherin-86C [Dufourea novaeangliae]|uniref:Cadherin-86C n=1 Tax=Dufourea novaeangliae TaxID=178035 RepID=A0A154PU49_DUFNO|nr:Cadherin-86C [Dufourea novaeangliae]